MADRFYGYQYDTNPRKLSPENSQIRNRYSRYNDSNNDVDNQEIRRTSSRTKTKSIQDDEEDLYLFERKNRQKANVSKERENINKKSPKTEIKKASYVSDNTQNAKKINKNIKPKLKIVMLLIAGFSVLFAMSYQNSLINESFNKKEQYKKEAEALSKTNQQLAVSIENSLNLNNIEQVAKEKLGMQKLSNTQKIYVNLPKQDYVAPAAEQVVIEEDTGFLGRIFKLFSRTIK